MSEDIVVLHDKIVDMARVILLLQLDLLDVELDDEGLERIRKIDVERLVKNLLS